ncbi:Fc.00g032930.m01.CDS01 [Cosmosporella sp. VM-42]
MSIPSVQDAVVVEGVGGPEVLEYRTNVAVPVPRDGQVVVKNTVSGVNFVDTYYRSGFYKSEKPEILGREGAGVVVAIGPKTEQYNLTVGDRVLWLGTNGYAQYTASSAAKVIKLPDGITEEDAGACALPGLTALTIVEESHKVKSGEWVLLHAAAGGVGVLLTQILKGLGAKLIATAGGPEKVALVKSLGADHVIDYRSEGANWVSEVKRITGGRGVDVVYDSVAKDTWEGSLESVKRKGTIVWFGNASGPVPPLTLHLIALKCVKIVRPTLFGYIETREELEYYCKKLFDLLITDKLKLFVHKVYPLSEVSQAHQGRAALPNGINLITPLSHALNAQGADESLVYADDGANFGLLSNYFVIYSRAGNVSYLGYNRTPEPQWKSGAHELLLYLCLNEYQTTVQDGESFTKVSSSSVIPAVRGSEALDGSAQGNYSSDLSTAASTAYNLNLAMFSQLVWSGDYRDTVVITADAATWLRNAFWGIDVNITDPKEQFTRAKVFYSGLETSMSSHNRSIKSSSLVLGTAWREEPFVNVRWWWLTFIFLP